MAKYGKIAQSRIEKNLHEYKQEGEFESRNQIIVAVIAQARKAGGKAPSKKND